MYKKAFNIDFQKLYKILNVWQDMNDSLIDKIKEYNRLRSSKITRIIENKNDNYNILKLHKKKLVILNLC